MKIKSKIKKRNKQKTQKVQKDKRLGFQKNK